MSPSFKIRFVIVLIYVNIPESYVSADPAGSVIAHTMLRDVEPPAIITAHETLLLPPVYLGIPVIIPYDIVQL